MYEQLEKEVRRILLAAFGSESLHGDLPASAHFARLNVVGYPEVWMLVYGDYMDFSYTGIAPPDTLIDGALAPLRPAQIIDWSPGRLACVQYEAADAASLSRALDGLIKRLHGLDDYQLVGALETWGRA
ncbi:hypothetical protein [Pseudoduganella sp. HUAS MS19]